MLLDHQMSICVFGTGGKLEKIGPDAAKAIGVRTCPTPEAVTVSTGKGLETCHGCLVRFADQEKITDPAHAIPTLAHILGH